MKPWRVLKVFGVGVPVFFVPELGEQEGMMGFYRSDKRVIGIDSNLKGEELEQTVVHEMAHAVLDRLYLQQGMAPEFAEAVIENLTVALFDNFKVTWRK